MSHLCCVLWEGLLWLFDAIVILIIVTCLEVSVPLLLLQCRYRLSLCSRLCRRVLHLEVLASWPQYQGGWVGLHNTSQRHRSVRGRPADAERRRWWGRRRRGPRVVVRGAHRAETAFGRLCSRTAVTAAEA